jgi:hypothetical protein
MIAAAGIIKSSMEEKQMRNIIVTAMSCLFFILVMSGVFTERAQAGTVTACGVEIFKEAASSQTLFEFLVDPSVGDEFTISTIAGDATGFGLSFGRSAVISEIVPDGWALENIECSAEGGASVIVDEPGNEVFVECLTVGSVTCTYTNVPTGAIPTLSQWGMIAAAAGLVLVGVWFVHRRRRAFNS